MAGKKATWRVLLAVLDGGKVMVRSMRLSLPQANSFFTQPTTLMQIYEGVTEGTLVHPAGDSNFGFDPIFKPNGSTKTLAEDKPDSVNARAAAV
jgi:hypothetical protein